MHVLLVFFLFTIVVGKRPSHNLQETRLGRAEASHKDYDFGHIYRNGFPGSKRKIDVEEDIVQADMDNAKNVIQKPNKNINPEQEHQPLFLSPRDEVLHHKKYDKPLRHMQDEGMKKDDRNANDKATRPPWFDFSRILDRNIENAAATSRKKIIGTKDDGKKKQVDVINNDTTARNTDFSSYFENNRFYKRFDVKSNWTTCSEFAKKAVFHPDDVINTSWLPFYIWSTRGFSSSFIHTFSYPTKKIVEFYKKTYGPYMQKVNWNEPKLLLRERKEILLIAGDRRGLFYGIPKNELPSSIEGKNITLPIMILRMKIHDPYLAIMYCDDNYAVIMAELGTEPSSDDDKTLEAKTLKFKGTGKPANRNIEQEAMLAELEKEKKREAESRKIIPIEISSFDLKVRNRFY